MGDRSQIDLLVRVRYQNTLPPPPYPPKMLDIPTDLKRYARPEFTQDLANETPLPMVINSECGMPLDLCHFDSLWDGTGNTVDAQNLADAPPIDPRDLFMLEGVAGAPHASGGANGLNVPWLRKTEYIAREAGPRQSLNPNDLKGDLDIPIDTSIPAQIRMIESTFPQNPIDVSEIKHPAKGSLKAMEVFEFLPDPDLWPSTYDFFRFPERPGERPIERPDPRLDCGLLAPRATEDGVFLTYYLPKEDEEAEEYKTRRKEVQGDLDESAPIPFHLMRTYEAAKIETDVSNEVLLVLDDLDRNTGHGMTRSTHDTKGAFYSRVQRKVHLKKKRATKMDEPDPDKIDIYQVSLQPFTADEEVERAEALATINDPEWLERMKLAIEEAGDAEGEAVAVDPSPVNGGHANDSDEDNEGMQD